MPAVRIRSRISSSQQPSTSNKSSAQRPYGTSIEPPTPVEASPLKEQHRIPLHASEHTTTARNLLPGCCTMASSVTRGRGVCRAAAVLSYCAAFFVAAVVYVSMGASAQIPFNADGYTILRRGSGAAALKVEVYVDLACSDCAAAWPVMTQVASEYGDQVEFLYRLFPLPYHRNAYTAAQATQVVHRFSRGEEGPVDTFMTTVFENQEQISNGATATMHQGQIEDIFSPWATATGVLSDEEFQSGMVDGELDVLARYQFKYGCLHAVYGTPMVYVGGVIAEGLDGGATFETWQGVLDPLLAGETLGVDSGVAEFVSR